VQADARKAPCNLVETHANSNGPNTLEKKKKVRPNATTTPIPSLSNIFLSFPFKQLTPKKQFLQKKKTHLFLDFKMVAGSSSKLSSKLGKHN